MNDAVFLLVIALLMIGGASCVGWFWIVIPLRDERAQRNCDADAVKRKWAQHDNHVLKKWGQRYLHDDDEGAKDAESEIKEEIKEGVEEMRHGFRGIRHAHSTHDLAVGLRELSHGASEVRHGLGRKLTQKLHLTPGETEHGGEHTIKQTGRGGDGGNGADGAADAVPCGAEAHAQAPTQTPPSEMGDPVGVPSDSPVGGSGDPVGVSVSDSPEQASVLSRYQPRLVVPAMAYVSQRHDDSDGSSSAPMSMDANGTDPSGVDPPVLVFSPSCLSARADAHFPRWVHAPSTPPPDAPHVPPAPPPPAPLPPAPPAALSSLKGTEAAPVLMSVIRVRLM